MSDLTNCKESTVVATKKKEKGISAWFNKMMASWQFWLLCIPGLLLIIVFSYVPMLGIVLAFKEYSSLQGIIGSPWVGIKYFNEFFNSPYFERILVNTVLLSVLKIAFSFPVPVLFAILLNEVRSRFAKKTMQTISYMPHFISTVIVVSMMKSLFSMDNGLINEILKSLGAIETDIDFFNDPSKFRTLYIASEIWQNFGWDSIIYMASISTIDMQLYEAAKLDGANRFQQVWHVTLPGLKPIIVTMLILAFGSVMSVGFEKVLLMYNPATYETSDVISTYIYRIGLVENNISYGVAVGLFNSVINFILIILFNKVSSKVAEVSLW